MENDNLPLRGRACLHCEEPIPEGTHALQKYCDNACRNKAYRGRNGAEKNREIVYRWRSRSEENVEIVKAAKRRHAKRLRVGDPERAMLNSARARAKKQCVPFDLSREDIFIPDKCPVLGIPIELGLDKLSDSSPTLDKIIPKFGYVRGNIIVVSWRANRLKSNAEIWEMQALSKFYTNLVSNGGWLNPNPKGKTHDQNPHY